MSDAMQKELDKIQSLTSIAPTELRTKSAAIGDSLDALLADLHQAQAALRTGIDPQSVMKAVNVNTEIHKKQIDERQKELHNAHLRFGKAVDKVRRSIAQGHGGFMNARLIEVHQSATRISVSLW